MAKGFRDLAANPESRALEHAEWLGLLVDQEVTLRQQKRFEARTRTAKLRQAATVEDVDFRKPRGLDRTLFLHLASCDWIREHRHCLITGACGTGKSFIELHRLRIGRQGLPGKSVSPLPAQFALVRSPCIGARRWVLAITSLLAPASVARRICARLILRAACLPPPSSAVSSARSIWLRSTRYRLFIMIPAVEDDDESSRRIRDEISARSRVSIWRLSTPTRW